MIALWVILGVVACVGLALLWIGRRRAPTPPGLTADLTRIYTTHAKERMQQRSISREAVEDVLAQPDRVSRDEVERSVLFEKDCGSRVVKVWVAAESWPPIDKVVVKSTAARHFASLVIPRRAIGRVIGRGGATVQSVQHATKARVTVSKDGTVRIQADERAHVLRAHRMISEIAKGGVARR